MQRIGGHAERQRNLRPLAVGKPADFVFSRQLRRISEFAQCFPRLHEIGVPALHAEVGRRQGLFVHAGWRVRRSTHGDVEQRAIGREAHAALAHRRLATLSSGERQRVQLGLVSERLASAESTNNWLPLLLLGLQHAEGP